MPIDFEEYTTDKLWKILVEVVHANVMYPTHKAYTRDEILPQKPDIAPSELAFRLGMPLAEAVVILYELQSQTPLK